MAADSGGWGRRGVLIGAIVAVVGPLAGYQMIHPRREPGPSPNIRALAKRMEAMPEFRVWARAHPDVAGDAPRAIRRGLHRLDDETLKQRLGLMTKIAAAVDVRRCAAFARGGGSQEDNGALLDTLSPGDRREYDEIIFRSAEAEVKGTPNVRWVSRQRREAFFRERKVLLARQPGGDRLIAALANVQAAKDADLCDATRALYRVVDAMPEPLRNTAGLVLLPGPTGHDLFDHPRWLALTDEALIARAQILEALLAEADEAQCAALARESATEGEVEALLQNVDAELQKWWPHLSHQLSFARGEDRRVTPADEARYATILNPQLERYHVDARAVDQPDDVSPGEACRAQRQFVSAVLRMPTRLRGIAARMLAGGGPVGQ
jgi:hypothetical protein